MSGCLSFGVGSAIKKKKTQNKTLQTCQGSNSAFTPIQLGQAPAPPQRASAAEAVIENGWMFSRAVADYRELVVLWVALNRSDITFLVELGKRFFISAMKTLNVWGIQGVFWNWKKKKENEIPLLTSGQEPLIVALTQDWFVVKQQAFLQLLLSYRGNKAPGFYSWRGVQSSRKIN